MLDCWVRKEKPRSCGNVSAGLLTRDFVRLTTEVKDKQSDQGRSATDLDIGTGGRANIVADAELKDMVLQLFDAVALEDTPLAR